MRYLALAAILLASAPALAVCPAHSNAIVATTLGTLRLCPATEDADGIPVVVGFPAARGSGGATATCKNTAGQVSAVASSTVTFRAGGPAAPGLSAVINPPVP